MKAVVYEKYGPPEVLELTEVEKPQPKDNEVLVKIHAATVTSGDTRLRSSDFPFPFWLPARLIFGLFKPKKKILGHEFSGIVEKTGKDITRFKVGDSVFGTATMLKGGTYAEYICIPEAWKSGVINKKPNNLNHQEAAALPIGAMTAMYLLENARNRDDQSVLVYGASGSVGSYAIQLAKQKNAFVTGVCSKSNMEMIKSLGADKVIDYKNEDYSLQNTKYDIVFDAVGYTKKSIAKRVLKPKGKFITVKSMTKETDEHFSRIKSFAESGDIVPFIDKVFNLSDIVEAHAYVDSGRKRGNVVIQVINS
ncbi:MAG: NAD(P)-dependent alcohol dehydrogenase [Crocinitomicaceae bacterium]|nr:NAD(P)-dependent alcohol dehydrogenase [Crocinitomicaceae bacterium]